jgi:hypothetical protein
MRTLALAWRRREPRNIASHGHLRSAPTDRGYGAGLAE